MGPWRSQYPELLQGWQKGAQAAALPVLLNWLGTDLEFGNQFTHHRKEEIKHQEANYISLMSLNML